MEREAVREYVEHAQSIIDSSPQMDEANTKAAILRDFLELLDWEIPTNTQLEYSVEAFGQTYKVDYALILEGTPVAFLEAKGADTALIDDHDDQLSSYMTNKNVTYGILTNGKQYRFFQRRVDSSNVDVQKVGEMTIENLPNRISVLRAFGKDAIESGEAVKILGRINELRNARQTLKAEKDDLATKIASVLSEGVSESISSLAESQSKELIDRLVEDIEAEIDADGIDSSSESVTSVDQSPNATDEYIISLRKDDSIVTTFSNDTQSDVSADAVNYLIENHDLISKIEPLPYIPGREKAIINNEPTSPHDSNAMRAYRELAGGYYLDTHANKDGKKRIVQRLADKCGFDVVFDGEW